MAHSDRQTSALSLCTMAGAGMGLACVVTDSTKGSFFFVASELEKELFPASVSRNDHLIHKEELPSKLFFFEYNKPVRQT